MLDRCFRYPRRTRDSRDCGCQFALLHRVEGTQRHTSPKSVSFFKKNIHAICKCINHISFLHIYTVSIKLLFIFFFFVQFYFSRIKSLTFTFNIKKSIPPFLLRNRQLNNLKIKHKLLVLKIIEYRIRFPYTYFLLISFYILNF